MPLEEAQLRILNEVQQLGPQQIKAICGLGLIFASDIISENAVPDFDNSGMDGYAVIASDLTKASVENPVHLREIGQIPAGTCPEFELKSGTTARIMTGAPLPPGADAVVPIEEIETDGNGVIFVRAVSQGENIRPLGNDIFRGELLYKAGQIIYPPDIGVLISIGKNEIDVHRKPRIGVLSTGEEITGMANSRSRGKIYDTNRPTLLSFLDYYHFAVTDLNTVADDPDAIGEILHRVADLDVLITTGGVSAGDYDYIPRVVRKLGGEIIFHRVKIKPGMPFMFARLGKTFIFGLPGNPQAVVVGFYMFVLPALRKMSGFKGPLLLEKLFGIMAGTARNSGYRPHFLPAKMEKVLDKFYIHPSKKVSSGALSGYAGADCMVIIPQKSEVKKGDEVQYIPMYYSN